MNRKLLQTGCILAASATCTAAIYLAFAFSWWGFNAGAWPIDAREFCAFFMLLSAGVGAALGAAVASEL